MPFGISTDEKDFWNVKELAYQHTHMFYGFWIGYIVYFISHDLWMPVLCGILSGLCMELYQYRKYLASVEWPRTWRDSIRDFCFWVIGGCLNYIIIFLR